jgi:hypothetical protein
VKGCQINLSFEFSPGKGYHFEGLEKHLLLDGGKKSVILLKYISDQQMVDIF